MVKRKSKIERPPNCHLSQEVLTTIQKAMEIRDGPFPSSQDSESLDVVIRRWVLSDSWKDIIPDSQEKTDRFKEVLEIRWEILRVAIRDDEPKKKWEIIKPLIVKNIDLLSGWWYLKGNLDAIKKLPEIPTWTKEGQGDTRPEWIKTWLFLRDGAGLIHLVTLGFASQGYPLSPKFEKFRNRIFININIDRFPGWLLDHTGDLTGIVYKPGEDWEFPLMPFDPYFDSSYLTTEIWEDFQEIPLTKRTNIQRARSIEEVYFDREDLDYLLPNVLSPHAFDRTEKRAYPDQGTFTVIYEKDLDKHKTVFLKFPEIPIELEGNVPHLAPMLFKVLVNTLKIAMSERNFNFVFRKKDQLILMGLTGEGDQFDQLTRCHATWYYLDAGVKDKRNPGWGYHRRIYNSFEHLPGKGGFIGVGLNPRAWPVLERFLENPDVTPKDYRTLPSYMDKKKISERQILFIIYLRKYRGLGKRFHPVNLDTVFKKINIFYTDIENRGMPWALRELDKCLKFAHENNELVEWNYQPSDESLEIIEGISDAVLKEESVQKNGPLWLSERLKHIHKNLPEIVKNLKKRGVTIPRKLDPFGVYHNWKIHLHLGDRKQQELFPTGQKQIMNKSVDYKIDSITEWHSLPIFKRRNPPKKIRTYLQNLVKAYGIEFIWSIYQQVTKSSEPHPNEFWRRIKEQIPIRGGTEGSLDSKKLNKDIKNLIRSWGG